MRTALVAVALVAAACSGTAAEQLPPTEEPDEPAGAAASEMRTVDHCLNEDGRSYSFEQAARDLVLETWGSDELRSQLYEIRDFEATTWPVPDVEVPYHLWYGHLTFQGTINADTCEATVEMLGGHVLGGSQ